MKAHTDIFYIFPDPLIESIYPDDIASQGIPQKHPSENDKIPGVKDIIKPEDKYIDVKNNRERRQGERDKHRREDLPRFHG